MKKLKISLSIGLLILINLSLEAQENSLDKWSIGLNTNYGKTDWMVIDDFDYLGIDHYYGLGLSLHYQLMSHLSLHTGLEFAKRDPMENLLMFCGNGAERYAITERGMQWGIPLGVRLQTNKKHRVGVHFDLGMNFTYLSGKARPFADYQRKMNYGHLFTRYNLGFGFTCRASARTSVAFTGVYGRASWNKNRIETGGLNVELLYRLGKK